MDRHIEILAPAGSYESMRAAMNAGCDAVYIGGSSFGARAYANNLEEEDLLRAVDEAHLRDKKLYLTVNTLIKENEMTQKLYSFLDKLYLEGLDAVIVQDVGVMRFIHRHFPKLPIHASTQTTLILGQGAELLKPVGVTRLVTARELSLKEIKAVRDNTDLEIETFVHGALCYCYSGQCLMSSMIGGRSGNRGRCAQPCRMPYQFMSGDRRISKDCERYLLSPKDINTIAIIPELIEAGVDSFKIEGRMKKPEYAAGVSEIYRRYTDLYFTLGKERYYEYIDSPAYEKDMLNLLDLYNRGGFSEGYGKAYHGKNMMSLNRPNHSGVPVGRITEVKGGRAVIALSEDIGAQDILEIRDGDSEEGYEFTVKEPVGKGDILTTNIGRNPNAGDKGIAAGIGIKPGFRVYRTRNNQLLNQLKALYLDKDQKLGISASLHAVQGERLKLTLSYKDNSVTAFNDIVQAALKQPMDKDKLSAPIGKLGDTPFYIEKLSVEAGDNIFVPVAWLNDLRREAVQLLTEAVIGSFKRNPGMETVKTDKVYEPDRGNNFGICASVQTEEQFNAVLSFSKVSSIYAFYDKLNTEELNSMAKACVTADKGFYLILPHICRQTVYERLKRDIATIPDTVAGLIAKNYEEIALLKSFMTESGINREVILDYNMYIFNKEAKSFWKETGINRFTAPVELNYTELKNLGINDCDLIVYGYQPLMVSAQCLHESTGGCQRLKAGAQRNEYLVDRLGKKFYVQTNCAGCYNTIYNGQCLSLIKYSDDIIKLNPQNIRLDFTFESSNDVQVVLTSFIDAFAYGKKTGLGLSDYTAGHFKRGVD